jgi:hypothetical protein
MTIRLAAMGIRILARNGGGATAVKPAGGPTPCAILPRVLRFPSLRAFLQGMAFAALLAAAGTGVAGEGAAPRFAPDPAAEEAPRLQGSTWLQEGEGYAIRLQRIDEKERQAYIQRATGLAIDPFATRPGHPPRFLSFLLEIENRTEGELALNPLDCWLMTNRKKIETPLGITDLSFDYHVAGADLPPAYENVGRVLLANPVAVKAGNALHGLLVFRAIDPKTRSFHVDVQLVLPDGNVARFAAPYRRVKSKQHGSR